MKKFAFAALLSIGVAAIAVTSGDSQSSSISSGVTNLSDTTTPMHHKTMHHKTMHHTMHKTAKPMKDSTK